MAQFPSTSAADGIWTLKKVRRAILGDNWPALPIRDAYWANTVLLLNADNVADAGQNNTFLDSSSNAHTITRNGNVTQGSFSPFSVDDGKWGNYFDGTGDYLTLSSDIVFGTSDDFTVEGWFYTTAEDPDGYNIVVSSTSGNVQFSIDPGNGNIGVYLNGTAIALTGTAVQLNTWQHIAWTRSGSTVLAFVDGVQVASGTNSSAFNIGTIGRFDETTYFGYEHHGYISNLRVIKGTALYTSAFTPSTTPLTAVSGTELLTCQSNRFVDNSSNAHSITVNGTPKVVPFSPFPQTTAYSASTNGGSGYFDGINDYLTTPAGKSSLALDGDFTINYWVYINSSDTYEMQISSVNYYQTGYNGNWYLGVTDSEFRFGSWDGQSNLEYVTVTVSSNLNEWIYVSAVRSGSTLTLYKNGVSVGSGTISKSLVDGQTSGLFIGRLTTYGDYHGYISGLEILKGVASAPSGVPTIIPTSGANTSLLFNFTNASIYDATGKNVLETEGNAQVDTTTFKYGTGAMEFDGTADYLAVAPNELFNDMKNGAFTIEGWVQFNANGNQGILHLSQSYSPGGVFGYSLQQNSSNNFGMYANGVANNSTKSVTTGVWYHFAMVRNSSGTLKLFIDGTEEISISDTTSGTQTHLLVGGYFSTSYLMNGYLDDLRITKGIARYTANFTPPEKELPVVG
jgi:hypothetical protein